MDRTLAVLNGATPAEAIAKYPGAVPSLGSDNSALAALSSETGATSTVKPVGGASAGTTYYSPSAEKLER